MSGQEQAMGEDAPHENLTDDSDWTAVKTRQQRRRQEKSSPSNNTTSSTPTLSSYQQGTRSHRIKGKIIRAGRMPRLPKEHDKVIIRPQGGLNIAHTPAPLLISAILAAAGLKKEDANEDILSPNTQQNIIVASSPSPVHTQRYKQIKPLIINNKSYDVNAYATTPDQMSKGVIRGIPLDCDNKTIEEEIIGSRNPLALAARRLGNTTAVIIVFDGLKVPRTVSYGPLLLPCTLYKKQIDICHQCGRLGHRMDVCPYPTKRIYRGCGARNPNQDHQCTPKCNLCGGEHQTADKVCSARFKTPYLIRRRRWENQRTEEDLQQDFPPLQPATLLKPTSRSRSRSKYQSRTNRSRAPSRSRSRARTPTIGNKVSWADTARGTPREGKELAPKSEFNLPPSILQRIELLEKENAELRAALQKYTQRDNEREGKEKEQAAQPTPIPVQTSESDSPTPKKRAVQKSTPNEKKLDDALKKQTREIVKVEIKQEIQELKSAINGMQTSVEALHNMILTLAKREEDLAKRNSALENNIQSIMSHAIFTQPAPSPITGNSRPGNQPQGQPVNPLPSQHGQRQ
ncbi:hypothetical protein HPB50_028573 [Hyalomma asiaticum]|nr:hypothetical protein HPB50_028573 [Hyalomma asiaticum]